MKMLGKTDTELKKVVASKRKRVVEKKFKFGISLISYFQTAFKSSREKNQLFKCNK